MKFLVFALAPLALLGQETPSPAQKEAMEAKAAATKEIGNTATAHKTIGVALSGGSPLSVGTTFLTGMLSAELNSKVASSQWAMNMTQKFSAKAIASYLTNREKQEFTVTNSKVEGLIVLTFTAKTMTAEKAKALYIEGDPVKFRKTGWDRVIFSNGTDSWAFDTSAPN